MVNRTCSNVDLGRFWSITTDAYFSRFQRFAPPFFLPHRKMDLGSDLDFMPPMADTTPPRSMLPLSLVNRIEQFFAALYQRTLKESNEQTFVGECMGYAKKYMSAAVASTRTATSPFSSAKR